MTSLELREIVNAARVEHGESKVRNDQFLARIEDELEGELGRCKTFAAPKTNTPMKGYDLTRDQCTLVGMRESKAVRRSVLAKLKSVETVVLATPIQRGKTLEIIEDGLRVAALFEVPAHYAQIEVVKEARRVTGVDYSQLLLSAPAQDNVPDDDVMLEPSQLAPVLGMANGAEVNTLLATIGLQYKSNAQWWPSDKGQSMCQRHSWSKGSKSGYNYKWSLAKIKAMLK